MSETAILLGRRALHSPATASGVDTHGASITAQFCWTVRAHQLGGAIQADHIQTMLQREALR
jgi:hypothetical protein